MGVCISREMTFFFFATKFGWSRGKNCRKKVRNHNEWPPTMKVSSLRSNVHLANA